MPNRIVREDILTSERVARLSWGAEVFYRRLMSKADDFGRFDGREAVLRTALFPIQTDKVSERDIGKWRLETVEAGLVTFYDVDGKSYVQIERFGEPRAKDSKYPAPPPGACAQTRADAIRRAQTPSNAPYSYSSSNASSESNPKEPPLPPTGGSDRSPRRERVAFDPLGIEFPPEMLQGGFPEAWRRWVAYRQGISPRLKPASWQARADEFSRYGPAAAVAAIDQSIANGWQGVFPEKFSVGRQLGFRAGDLTFQGLKDFVAEHQQ